MESEGGMGGREQKEGRGYGREMGCGSEGGVKIKAEVANNRRRRRKGGVGRNRYRVGKKRGVGREGVVGKKGMKGRGRKEMRQRKGR